MVKIRPAMMSLTNVSGSGDIPKAANNAFDAKSHPANIPSRGSLPAV